MVLKPEDIEQSDFTTSRRGYDKDEVRSFLRNLAGEVRGLQERDPGDDAAAYLPLGDSSDISSEDRFGALGDRIATLLREAHDASEQTRETASNEATETRAVADRELEEARTTAATELEEARSEAERVRQEADTYRVAVDEEAIQIRNQAEIDGNARLDERRDLIEEQEVQIATERETAMAELSDARSQVASLLQEARAQSEFIKREAEEIIRAKVRANMDKAQRRIDILRTTEESSKDRILTAQRELESALTRLEAEPVPEFPSDTEDSVVLEAEGRVAEAQLAEADAAEVDPEYVEATGSEATEAQVIEAQATEAEVIEVEAVEVDTEGPNDQSADAESDEIVDPQSTDEDETGTFSTAFPAPSGAEVNETTPWNLGVAEESPSEGMFGAAEYQADTQSQADAEGSKQDVASAEYSVAENDAAENDEPVTDSSGDTRVFDAPVADPQPTSEPIQAPTFPGSYGGQGHDDQQPEESDLVGASIPAGEPAPEDAADNEDALARLVREAMQRAVDSARGE